MLKIRDILRYIGNWAKTAGTVYSDIYTASVPTAAGTNVVKLTLPPGAYMLTGWAEWRLDRSSALTILSLVGNGGSGVLSKVRGTMWAGGGDCVASACKITTQETFYLSVYHTAGINVHCSASIRAVRIK